MSFPTFTTEINFSGSTWTDVSDYVRVVSRITRGRNTELDSFDAGKLSLVLGNNDGRFDPTNTSSPYSPNVKPMRKIRVQATYSAVTYPVFQGFIENWDPMWQVEHAWVPITAVDMSILLSGAEVTGNPYDSQTLLTSPEGYWKLSESSSEYQAADLSGNGRLGTYHGDIGFGEASPIADDPDGVIRLSGSGWVNLGEGAAVVGTGDFSITGWFETTATGIRYLLTQLGPTYTGATEEISIFITATNYLQFNLRNSGASSAPGVNDGLAHHFAAVREAGVLSLYLDGVLQESVANTTNLISQSVVIGRRLNLSGFGWDGMAGRIAIYHTALSAAEVLSQYQASTAWSNDLSGARIVRMLDLANIPAGDRDVDTGNTRLMPAGDIEGSVYEHIERVTETEGGAFFISRDGKATFRESLDDYNSSYLTSQGTFGDDTGELPVGNPSPTFNRQSIRNSATVTRRGGTPQIAEDATSVQAPPDGYGKLTFTKEGQLMNSDQEALSQAQWIVFRYKDPELRVDEILLEPHTHDALWVQVLGRELRDRITLNLRPPGGGPTISKDFHIERMTHAIGPGPIWNTTWGLSPVDSNDYWYMEVTGFSEMETATVMG